MSLHCWLPGTELVVAIVGVKVIKGVNISTSVSILDQMFLSSFLSFFFFFSGTIFLKFVLNMFIIAHGSILSWLL